MEPTPGVSTDVTQPVSDASVLEPVTEPSERAVAVRLVLGSSIMLFIELALIRWLGSAGRRVD